MATGVKLTRRVTMLFFFVVTIVPWEVCAMANAQEQPTDAELAKLKLELEQLKVRVQIAEAKDQLSSPSPIIVAKEQQLKQAELDAKLAAERKKLLEASLPSTEAKALEGKITIDDKVVIETETLAHRSLKTVASTIAEKIKTSTPGANATFIIHNDHVLSALLAYRAFTMQAKLVASAYEELVKGPTPFAFPAAVAVTTAALKSAIDLLALFRSDIDIKGITISLDESALVSEVGGRLSAAGFKVFYPHLYPIDAISDKRTPLSGINEVLEQVRLSRENANTRIAALTTGAEKQTAEARLGELDKISAGMTDALFKRDEQAGLSPVAILIRGEAIENLLGGTNGRLLYLKVLKAGGSNRVKRNLFTGSKLTHSGGIIVNFIVFSHDGSIVLAETVSDYSGYVDSVSDKATKR